MTNGLINTYKDFLPVTQATPIITLGEGNTPLIKLSNFPAQINLPAEIHVKVEGSNPTGSFKDRGMTMAVSKAKEENTKMIICASTGNTSASAAAYAAHAGLNCAVVIPEGQIAMGKLSQAIMHGAIVIQIEGNFDDALQIVRDITNEHPITLVNHLNPNRIQGQKTAAFEIIDALGDAPDYHAIPVGNAGNITAHWIGYNEYQHNANKSTKCPKMIGFQAAGAAPIVDGHPIKNPETIATAIRIGNPASWKQAEAARDESGGIIDKVMDEEITNAQKLLASTEGIFCEPASAASIAGVIKLNKEGKFKDSDIIVATLTGHGLKDPDRAIEISTTKPELVKSDKNEVFACLKSYID